MIRRAGPNPEDAGVLVEDSSFLTTIEVSVVRNDIVSDGSGSGGDDAWSPPSGAEAAS